MGQGLHEDIPGDDVFPAGQGVQEVAGSIVESLKVPAGQVEHDIGLLPPALELKVPDEHFMHASDEVTLYLPASQIKQDDSVDLPVLGLYVPMGHGVQADD